MSHVADGDLHAYLDDALEFYPPRQARRIREHLERCPECRRRLDAEAQLASEARSVLAEATPSALAVPPLEELRRRADLVSPVASGPARPATHLRWAWAATVVLALGIGWGVGAWPSGSGSSASADAPVLPSGVGAAPAQAEARTSGSGAAPSDDARPPVLAEAEAAQKSEALESGRVAAAPPAVEASGFVDEPEATGAATRASPSALAEAPILERRAPELPPVPLAGDPSAQLSDRVGASVAPSVTPQPVVTTADASRMDAGADRREQAQLERPMVSETRLGPGPVGDFRFSDPRTQAVGPSRALDRQERAREPAVRPPLTLPGLALEIVEEGDVGPDPAVHVRQRRADGLAVELYFVGVAQQLGGGAAKMDDASVPPAAARAQSAAGASAAAEPASPPAPPEHVATSRAPIGLEQVIVPFRGGWLIAHAPLSRAELLGLLRSAGVPLP
jgi:hypothetical protein